MIITANKKRFPILMILCIPISVLLLLLIIYIINHYSENKDNGFYLGLSISGALWALYLGILTSIDYIKTLLDKSATFTISDAGIEDRLSIFSVGTVNWEEIRDIRLVKVYKANFLVIDLVNPQLKIDNQKIYKKRILNSFAKKFGSPVVISHNRINYDLNGLKNILEERKSGD